VAECKPLPRDRDARPLRGLHLTQERITHLLEEHARHQGLTLVHFPAQLKHFLWDRGCIEEVFMGCLAGVQEVSRGITEDAEHFLCRKRLKLS
jgi:hypothetical protein